MKSRSLLAVIRPHVVAFCALCVLGPHFAPAQTPAGRILVVPFENRQLEPRLHWLSEASAVLLADELKARRMGAITREERVKAFEELHLPLSGSLTRATIIKVGQIVGASEVIVGAFALDGNNLRIDAHSIRVDVGRLQPNIVEQAPLAELFPLFERLARRLAPGSPDATRGPRPPLDAFENYIKGLIAESPAAQATFLETAVEQFPGYDHAGLALWGVRSNQDDHLAALSAARAVSSSSPLARRARFFAGVSLIGLKRYDEAFELFQALVAEAPVSREGSAAPGAAAALNNLGIVQIRRGGTSQTGTATFYLTKAADADPGEADYLFNLGYAYVLERNHQGAVYWLREAVRRNPADPDAHYVLAAALQALGNTVEAAREKDLARQLSSHYQELERRAAADKMPVPKGLERTRVDPDAPGGFRPEQAIVNAAQREQREVAIFHLDRGRRLYEREEDREAMLELRRAIYLSPYEAQAHLLIGRIHLRAGRPQDAIEALKISVWSEDSAAARVAMAEAYLKLKNTAAARTELERALVLDPASAEAKRLLAELK
jgi:tetratricopeptide (TPR) repeat protein